MLQIGLISLVVIATLIFQFDNFIFHPSKQIIDTPLSLDILYENIVITSKTGSLHAWLLSSIQKSVEGKIIIYSHGNAGNISHRMPFIEFWKKYLSKNCSLLLYDYPGFGLSSSVGKPTIKNCKESLKQIINFVKQRGFSFSNMILYGESIGGAISVAVAVDLLKLNIKFNKIILQSSFTTLRDVAQHLHPILSPILFFLTEPLDVVNDIKILRAKDVNIIVLHSKNDEIIPFYMFLKLVKVSTQYIQIDGTHNDPVLDHRVINIIMN